MQLKEIINSKENQFWKARSNKYNDLKWVNNNDLLGKIYMEVVRHAHEIGKQKLRILDIGTGTGKVLEAIYTQDQSHELWGLDLSKSMLDKIKNKANYNLLHKDIEKDDINFLGIVEEYFDIIIARMVFHHLKNWDKVFQKLKRILKHGGIIIICEGNPPNVETIRWYEEMFKYKEERRVVNEIDLINLFFAHDMKMVDTKSVLMKENSLMNWLDSSDIDNVHKSIIKKMHYDAPEDVKKAYNMQITDEDILMDWKFSITSGMKL